MKNHLKDVTVSGNRIVYYERGSGPVLVLLHGMFGDHLDWEPVLEPFSRTYRVIAPDLPGFGDSDKPNCDYSAEFFLASLKEFFTKLGVTSMTLVGNSFGGSISIHYTLAHAEQVERLGLVSSGGMRSYSETEVAQVNARFNEANVRALTPGIQELMLSPIFARMTPQRGRYFEKQAAKLGRPDFPAYTRSLSRAARMAFPLYLRDRLADIHCPTLLVWGDADVVFPVELARAALDLLPDGRLALLLGCGHVPQLDDPVAFVSVLRDFVPVPAVNTPL